MAFALYMVLTVSKRLIVGGRMKRIKRNILILTSSLLLLLAFQNCSKTGIQVSDKLSQVASDVDTSGISIPEPVQTEKASETFSSSSRYKTMDMVWVVDNSASMTKNVTQTKNNISAFFSSLRQEMDINFTLITKEDATNLGTSFKLSDYTSLGSQINFMVHSYNPMLIAAASTCPVVPDANDVLCNQVKNNYRYNEIYGSLNGFFRPGSLKVFVFVTDDDSATLARSTMQYNKPGGGYVTEAKAVLENDDFITVDTFKQRMASAFGSSSSFKSFGFLALPNGASCRARVSQAYMDLNAFSGGPSFDICESDWSANFNSLTSSVLDFADTTYVVNDPKFVSVDSVELDGVLLKANVDYKVNGHVITLDSSLVATQGTYSVRVNYTRKL